MNIRDKKYRFIQFYDVKNVKKLEKESDVIRIETNKLQIGENRKETLKPIKKVVLGGLLKRNI